ncbi:MAG: hypothetical protein U9R74_15290 [Pseudomonadota bacterium]|nr:hypothetical protein [Pseudomonadota bacterium]
MGKTSVMYRLLDQPRSGFHVVHLNVEPLETPAEFFISLIDAVNEHQPDFLHRVLAPSWGLLKELAGRVEGIEFLDFKVKLRKAGDWDAQWRELAVQFMDRVAAPGEPILFIIDELPDMLTAMQSRSREDLTAFLHMFRKMRQTPGDSHIRWMVGGSVNIRGTLDEIGQLKLINDFRTEVLPPLRDSEVNVFVTKMLTGRDVSFEPGIIPEIQRLLGNPIPFFLQLLTQELYRHWRRQGRDTLTPATVQHVFQHVLLGEAAHDKLQHFHSRIRLHYPEEDQEPAYALLDHLSLTQQGASLKVLLSIYTELESSKTTPRRGHAVKQSFNHLLLRLQSDFYVERSGDHLDFGSRLLKVWWKRNYGYDAA